LLIQILLESDNKADGKTPIAVPTPVVVDNEPKKLKCLQMVGNDVIWIYNTADTYQTK
jgi:hypothetical protein